MLSPFVDTSNCYGLPPITQSLHNATFFFFCFRCKKPHMLPSCPPPQTHAQLARGPSVVLVVIFSPLWNFSRILRYLKSSVIFLTCQEGGALVFLGCSCHHCHVLSEGSGRSPPPPCDCCWGPPPGSAPGRSAGSVHKVKQRLGQPQGSLSSPQHLRASPGSSGNPSGSKALLTAGSGHTP